MTVDKGRQFGFKIDPKHKNLVEDRTVWLDHFLSSFVKFRSAVSEEKSKLSQPIRGRGGHLLFPIGPKNTNLVEDIYILLHVKFRWIPFSSFREVKNVSVNQRPGGHLVFLISPKNTNLVEDIMILLPVKFHWILFRAFRGDVRNASANQRPERPSCFLIGPKTTDLIEDVETCLRNKNEKLGIIV